MLLGMTDAAAPGTVQLLLELLDNSSIPLTAGEPAHLGGVLSRPKYAWKIVRARD